MEIFSRRCKISPLIVAVICVTFFHNVLSKHKIRHFKDRFKRQQGANLYLPGSYVQDNYEQETGPWEEWSAPSPCSRTCGGGVSTQSRTCTQGYECTGPSAKHFTCNTQDCPDLSDYRTQQCADHNSISFEGVYYEWVPYTKAINPCELNCMPKGERFYYRHADAVIDGTRCNDEEYDVCVKGKCQPVGCDRMLGSNAREDQCRVCGGNGSTCNTFTNTIPMKDMQSGYNDILLIPAGATNIRIEELAPSNNYLAVRNKTGFYYLNGNWKIDFPRSIDFAGSRFKYDRQPQEFDAPDIITALGPTDESLFIVLLYQDADIPISYSYSLPTSLPPPSTERYSWIYDEFTPCTADCGKGVQYRNVSCAGRNSLESVDETLCDRESKPQAVQSCNEVDCEPTWIINPWSKCSYPCGKGGTKTRQVTCQKISANGLQEVVSDDICSKKQNKPSTEEKCNEGNKCAKWHTDPWKPCDHLCGPGKQTRKVLCYIETDGKKEILNDNDCQQVEQKPEEEKACNVRPCEGVDWLMSQWSGCDKCGLTNETRKVFCATASGEIQSDDLCEQERKPEIIRECDTINNTCQYLWYASQWSECSATCGQGVQTRTIFCGASTVDGVQKVENDKCDPSKNFDTIKNCTGEKETCDGEWFSGPWGECSKPCGGGERTKKVVCVKENQVVDASSCDGSKIEFSEETCNQQPCSEDTIMPTDITQAVDESEPTKETSQKREATTTPVSTDTKVTEVTEPSKSETSEVSTGFETTTSKVPTTTENPDDFEIVPDDNCDDGEWVDVDEGEDDEEQKVTSEEPQGDDPFAFNDIMLGDQVLLVGSGDSEGSSSSSSTWSTDSSTSTDSTWSTESTLSTSEFEGSGTTPEELFENIGESEVGAKIVTTAAAFTGSTEEPETTSEFTGSTEEPGTTTEFTGSTESTESTTAALTESTTEFTGSTESTTAGLTETTTEFTGSTESTESTTEGVTESTTEFTGSTESTESTTAALTESTTEFTGSTESTTAGLTETTTEFTGSTESTESTTEGVTESTTEFTGSTESTESTTAALTESTTEFTGSTESTTVGLTETTTEFTGSTESTESTTEGVTESTTEFTGSTESTESTTAALTESTTEFTGSTESTESTTAALTESTTEFTGSTEATESTTEFTGSTESTESTTAGSTESTTEFTGSTESTESTTEGSTQSTTEFTGSTESTESTTEFTGSTESTESTTEFTGSTESTESTVEYTGSTESTTEYGVTLLSQIFKIKPRMCKRRKVKGCQKTTFGCCWDNITPAEGPFDKGCPTPHTCKEAKYGCCDDGVSAALGPKKGGCPRSQCKETLFGCCSDNKTPAEGNENEGCPPECLSSNFGCCDDNSTQAEGPNHKGCPEESTTEISTTEFSTSEFSTVSGETEITSEFTTETGSTIEVSTVEVDCESTPYRCCPDGITPATGPGFQGCNLPCSETKYGCCQDAKTPAHGPSGEGCCLSSTFGCCPDNTSPARGPNNDGCDCQFSPYGCCPDNKTASQGYEKEGCGCEYTEFGCCPDGYTKAQGADLMGCQCHTFQFGCCPDGVTSAKGPHQQGCGCRNSEFGCCSDEKTPASGQNMEGCSCENTKFGCCLDGITESKGENFEGCESVPQNLQVGCSIPKERGVCRNYTVKWFFDMDYGGCSRFWYGGCDGNENRYKSKEECEQLCVNPEGVGRCNLPKVAGPCEGYYPQWYYDKNLKTCTQFVYGGCLGNNNRFETREECLGLCVKDSNSDSCQQKKDEGPCQGQYQRFFFDKDIQQCQEFTYGGCKGNNNNFATVEACKQQCTPPDTKKDYCTEPKAEGNCTEVYATWYYDATKKSCAPFYFTGCNGNLNNFESKEACETQCPPEIEKDTCQLPAETGECANYVDRWYYDTREKTCRQFYYGGCGGNGNNFETQQNCQERCEKRTPPQARPRPEPEAQPTSGPSEQQFTIDQCFQPSETGPCRAAFAKYFYDASDGVCKSFIYGGCQGNRNNFDRIEDCLQKCGNAQDLCTLPAIAGNCEGRYPQYYYDQGSDSCREFVFSGCDGNYNRFQDQQSCEQRCKKSVPEPTYTQAPTSASQAVMCFESPDPGTCDERITAFYYDPTRRLCQPFIYGGCGGNNNRFNSEEQCQRQCGDFQNQDVCQMQRDPGPCRGYFVKYYYDRSSGRCNQFAYGGCQGNGNRFSSEEECAQICITHQENKPNLTATALCRLPVDQGSCEEGYHKRWYFDDARGECIAFIFSGCGGNFNNFKSFQQCVDYCRELLPPPVEPQIPTDMPAHPCQEAFDECTTLMCPYGVEPFVDENECNRCRCRDPCVEVECLADEQCAIDLNRNKTSPQDADFIAICRKQNKPGYCPSLDINDNHCEKECGTDADCTLHLKCCSTGCGTACVDPTPPGQLVTQEYQPAYTDEPIQAEYQPPQVDPIEYKPEIAASIGDQATLRCAVSGNPNPKIRWSKDNIMIDGTQPRYRIKLDQSLQIITLHKTDSGIYLCTATNGIGDPLINKIKLDVLDSEPKPVSILAEPGDEQPLVVSLNSPATLNCYVLGYPFPAVTWWKDDSIIPFKNNEFEIRKDYSLLIHSVQLQNLGIYTCQAYNGYGKAASWSVTVKARGPIRFNNPQDEQYDKFIVNPEENSPPTTPSTTTTRRELPPRPQGPYTPYYPPYVPSYTEPSNEIIPNTLPDAQAGRPPPSITVPVRANITTNDQKYPVGSDIEIPCEFGGYPVPQVQWFKDGVQLIETDKIHIRETERTSILTVEEATKAESGYYQCEATNAYNKASSALEISIQGMYIHPSCTDNQFFANCALIVKAKYCTHKYYAKFCCRSCTEAGLLPVDGPHIQNFNRQNSLNNNLI